MANICACENDVIITQTLFCHEGNKEILFKCETEFVDS